MRIKWWCGAGLALVLFIAGPVQAGLFDSLKNSLGGGSEPDDSGKSPEERALSLYRKGKKSYESGDYQGAREHLSKALELYSSDGKIRIVKDQQVEWVETPRGLERRVVSDSTAYDYYPNRYMGYVSNELARIEKERQEAWTAEQQSQQAQMALQEKFANPPHLLVRYDLIDSNRDNILSAKESAKVVVTVENAGKSMAESVEVAIWSSTSDVTLGCCDTRRKLTIGNIAPGQSVIETLEIIATEKVATGSEKLSLTATEADGFGLPEELQFAFATQEYMPAAFAIVDQRVSHLTGNSYEVSYTVVNQGKGPAVDAVTQIRAESRDILLLGDSEVSIGQLAVNASQRVSFTFAKTNRLKSGDRLPVALRAIDKSDESTQKEFTHAMVLPAGGASQRYAANSYQAPTPLAPAASAIAVEPVDTDIPTGAEQIQFGRAFVIGNGRYAALDPVDFAENDASVVAQYAKKTLGFKKTKTYLNEDTFGLRDIFGTKEKNFKDGDLYNMVKRDSELKPNPPVFIYYSGHGAPGLSDGKAYLVPVDAQMERLDQQGYPLEDLYAAIKNLPTNNVTLVLDSCFSGNTDTSSGKKTKALYTGVSPAAFKTNELKPGNISNLTLFTSASASEVSYWHKESRHGLFTYNFLRALRGSADNWVKGNKDGVVSAEEIQNFVSYEVAEYIDQTDKGSKQTPGLSGQTSKPLAILKK
ncbi:MAG: hypothetical protein CMN84_07650 [Spongiibacteraceae bacterium]|nr:hypothetical protein [Spongiibacteraceae bacterium]